MSITYNNWIINNKLPRIESIIIISKTTNMDHAKIIANLNQIIPENILIKINNYLAHIKNGVPIAYIFKEKEFFSRNFYVDENVLIPRPETEILIENILHDINIKSLKNNPLNILELGTGSGIIAITLKLENPKINIFATDISKKALIVAKKNAKELNAKVTFIQSNWFKNIDNNIKFDYIVSNPPYIAKNDNHLLNLQYEPLIALSDNSDGLAHIKIIISKAKTFLNKNGSLWLEHGFNQGNEVRTILKNNQYSNIKTIKDYANLDRISTGRI